MVPKVLLLYDLDANFTSLDSNLIRNEAWGRNILKIDIESSQLNYFIRDKYLQEKNVASSQDRQEFSW